MALLEVKRLSFTYASCATPALRGVSFALQKGAFAALCGLSGSGKSTLLRLLKPGLAPAGEIKGEVIFDGVKLDSLSARNAAAQIGFVGQDPAAQIVTDKVWHELAFGMESLGYSTEEMRRKAAETAAFFGIDEWFHRRTDELSGGQMQLLNLAAVTVLQPKLLLLDEPTAQLDPVAAETFLSALQKLNRELGTTVLLCEHRLENVLPLCDKALVLDGGALLCAGDVPKVGAILKNENHPFALAMPTAMRVFESVESALPCPVSVRQGQEFLQSFAKEHPLRAIPADAAPAAGETALEAKEVFFRYEKDAPQVLRDFSLAARRGELLCLLGGNGAGKTTALHVLAGLLSPQHGDVNRAGKVALLPQDPTLLFLKSTLGEDLRLASPGVSASEIDRVCALCRLQGLSDRHPFDLSGGEQQRAALAKLLLQKPDILLLDEPTKGFDAAYKADFAALLGALKAQGVCVVMVSHDTEFCAAYADRCALLFDGAVTAVSPTRAFFCGNRFYTTAAHRMAHELLPDAVTANDLIRAVGGVLPKNEPRRETPAASPAAPAPKKQPALPLWRKIAAAVCGAGALGTLIFALTRGELQTLTDAAGVTPAGKTQLLFYGVFFALLFAAVFLLSRKPDAPARSLAKTDRRGTWITVGAVLLGVPTLLCGVRFFGTRGFYFLALALLLEAMLPFFLRFEHRRPGARELVVLASLCALNVAGRAAFFMLPQFKPVLALTVLVGVALGAERGFLVGAVTMLVSNVLFSQGPWTPWQMFAMGLVGALAGWLTRLGVLRGTRLSLSVFGAVCAVVIYSGILNPASALLWGGEALNLKLLLSYYVTGLPMDLVHAAASFLFLWVLTRPMLEQLERVRRNLER